MLPLEPIKSHKPPREILATDFQLHLPIRGGWGYTQVDACIIDKHDPIVNPAIPFHGIGIEEIFVEHRCYEEMIIFRPEEERLAGIRWKRQMQYLIPTPGEGRIFDRLVFTVTAFRDQDWEQLKAAYEGPSGYGKLGFDPVAHAMWREEKKLTFTKEFWFDITSFYGQLSE